MLAPGKDWWLQCRWAREEPFPPVVFLPRTQDGEEVTHKPGDRWLIRGPLEYVPPAEVEVLERRHSIPLAENEGIYVRDIKTGKVSGAGKTAVTGYRLLLEKPLRSAA